MLKVKVLAFRLEEDEEDNPLIDYDKLGLKPPPEKEKDYYFRDGYINPYGIAFITETDPKFKSKGALTEINYNAGESCLVNATIDEIAKRIETYWEEHDAG